MTPSDDSLREPSSGLTELRRVLSETPTHVLLGDGAHDEQPLRHAARALAADARTRDAVRAERLLIELRRMWRDLPEARHLEPKAHDQLWERLVTACIEEFYRTTNEPR